MKDKAPGHDYLSRLLSVSNQRGFKIWLLLRPLRFTAQVLAVLALIAVLYICWAFQDTAILTWGAVGWTTLTLVVGLVLGKAVMHVLRWQELLMRFAAGFGMGIFGWIAAQVHLRVFDKIFLRYGSLNSIHRAK